MCATKEPKSQFEDIEELKRKIKILSKKIIKLKPELEPWINKHFSGDKNES